VGIAHSRIHALKVHFPFRISRYGRRMRDEVVEQAVAVSAELESRVTARDASFAFLREVIGVTHKNLDQDSPRGENWGYLVRDMVPFPETGDSRPLVPGFALYGRDFSDPDREPLILGLMDPADPAGWLLEQVMLPIVRQWVACFRETGFVLEPHGQNILLELDSDLTDVIDLAGASVRRIVHRDLSVAIDVRRRRDTGLENASLNNYNRMESGAFNSIAYDRFMGGHFFDSLLEPVLERHPTLRAEDLREPVKHEFERSFPDHRRYMPKTVHYFSEERDRFGKPLYKDTGRAPNWRP
jgi:hypothetical protein